MDAFIDESMRADGKGVVVLAAVCVDAGAAGDARGAMQELLLGRQARIHFHDEGHVRRMAIVETVAGLHLPAIVAAAVSPAEPRAFERARRKCIERLAYEVPQRGVTALLLESRQENLNKSDRTLLAAYHRSGLLAKSVMYGFRRPKDEPVLWVADAVAGAVSSALANVDERYYAVIESQVDVIHVDTT